MPPKGQGRRSQSASGSRLDSAGQQQNEEEEMLGHHSESDDQKVQIEQETPPALLPNSPRHHELRLMKSNRKLMVQIDRTEKFLLLEPGLLSHNRQ